MKRIPLHSLIVLINPSNSDKYDYGLKFFPEYEVVSFKKTKQEMVGNINLHNCNIDISKEINHKIRSKLNLGERVVIDSKSIHIKDRTSFGNIGKNFGVPVYYLIFEDDKENPKYRSMFKSFESQILQGDGIAEVVDSRYETFNIVNKIPEENLYNFLRKQGFKGITAIADVHGMLQSMKSAIRWGLSRGHFILFLGDIIDYGPKSIECINEVYSLVMDGQAGLIYGNHERKIEKWLYYGSSMHISEGSRITINQIESLSPQERQVFELRYKTLMKFARNHFVIGDNIFTHGAASPEMFEIFDIRLRDKDLSNLSIFGKMDNTTPKRDNTVPKRIYDWVDTIPSNKTVIAGHDIRSTTSPFKVKGRNNGNVIFLDTGSGKGGTLSSVDLRFKNKGLFIENFNKH